MFAGNSKVVDGLLIAGLSIVKHCKEPIMVYLLTMGLTDICEDYKIIEDVDISRLQEVYSRGNSNSRVVKIDVGDLYRDKLKNSPNSESFYTPYALLRLLAEELLEIPDKVLYLDADIVANGDVGELYNIDISNYEIAGVRDYYGKFFFYPRYLNSGVLLMNMRRIRETKMLSRALGLCQKKKVFLPDQTAINRFAKKKLILPSKYNEQNALKSDTVIRHFSMSLKFFPKFKKQNIKPWHIDKVHSVLKITEFDDIFEEYSKLVCDKEVALSE